MIYLGIAGLLLFAFLLAALTGEQAARAKDHKERNSEFLTGGTWLLICSCLLAYLMSNT